jgi:hypothetical protein
MLKTQNVYVDTEQWRGIRFDWNNDLAQALLMAAKGHRIRLLTTDILKGEIKSHLLRGIENYVASLRKAENSKSFALAGVVGAWRTLDFAELQGRLEVELENSMHRFFNAFSPTHIPYRESTLNAVLLQYFDSAPPFDKRSDKKHEFPDAIVLESIKAWCGETGMRAYVVSQDQGVKSYCDNSEGLIGVDTIGSLLGEMNDGSAEDDAMKGLLDRHRAVIATAIEDALVEMDVHFADLSEDLARVFKADVLITGADLIYRPSETEWVSHVTTKNELEVIASGDDPRSVALYEDGKVTRASRAQNKYLARLEATFKVVISQSDGEFTISDVEAVGAQSIHIAAAWSDGPVLGVVPAYLEYPGLPF